MPGCRGTAGQDSADGSNGTMETQGPGRRRTPNRDKQSAEDDALTQIAREAETRLAMKRAARAEAREIRMKELERQQKELFLSHKRCYGVENKWGHIEQWMEDTERYSRFSRRHTSVSDDEEKMSVGSRSSLRPSDYSSFLGSGSRASSRASSARASPVVEERTDRDFMDKGSRTASTLSAATLASLAGVSSRRESCDTSFSLEMEASLREMKDSLTEAEERYRRAMVSNAQLHNDKTTLMYQVETLREELSDTEELLWEARRHSDNTSKELERERHSHSILKLQFRDLKDMLKQTEELLTALERQREISDIIRIERDRLRDEVVHLRDSLKKHGFEPRDANDGVSVEGGAEDNVSTESGGQLAEEWADSNRESTLGKASPGPPAEGRQLSQEEIKRQHGRGAKGFQPPSLTPTVKTVKQSMEHKHQHRLEETKKQKNKREKNPARRCPPRPDGHPPAKTPMKDQTILADGTGSTEKVFKSRLVPPRPVKDILLDHKTTVLNLSASGSRNLLPEEKKPPAEEMNFSVGGAEQSFPLTALEKEGLMSSSWRSSVEDAASNMSSFSKEQQETCDVCLQTPGSCLKEREPDGIDEETVQEKVGPTTWPAGTEDSYFSREINHLGHPEVQSPETKLEPEGDGPPHSRRSGIRKSLKDWRIHEARANQILRGCFEQHSGQVSDSMFAALRNTFQGELQGLVHHWGSVTEMTKVLSEVLIALHKWIIDLDHLMTGGGELDRQDVGPEGSMRHISSLSAEGCLMYCRPNQLREDPACLEVPFAGQATALKSDPVMLQPSGSTDQEEKQTIHENSKIKRSQEEDFADHPAVSKSAASETESFTEDFVFVDSYFAEPLRSSVSKSKPHLGQQLEYHNYHGSFPLSDNYYHNRQQRTEDGNLHAGQSSKVRRLIETTAEEIKAMAVPELVLVSLQEGRQLNRPSSLNCSSPEEQLSGEMDSCEEADEEQGPPPRETPGIRSKTLNEKEVQPESSTKPEGDQEGGPLDHRREEDTDCKLS
ncbi:uncharacterized protein lrrfip1b isoform X4 [Oryzias melastigma]|uniref:uncharacterized protein lrrfip1b isoform X4 n=1 Tax=Oryzias melastigma TaxID=30732 RepID=UPI000CF7FBDE|nr:uncharacterized protein lrrfip1b isoform X4 [Oryzias melastigma]